MMSLSKTCMELLEIINQQEEMIKKQNETIARLVNENAEKGNMIDELVTLPY